ncbi:uncharacterized protein TM35_000771120 [Trypanosoma theileri]|uniref:Surface protein TolT n=1 Tax=Trypanosoma theileri TaxID=67003 RepID=A0A1X0NF16_9TRYP|nr:uncharacterized protein TM35_000771120 [Trypanosoma theileri]ORC83150.1 hypothetical protein TM35_000771120 [Trypanosoma theileri]
MSMLPCRVLCLLAIVLCCVGVVHANAAAPAVLTGHEERIKEAQEKVKETLRLKEECEKVIKAAEDAAYAAQVFAVTTENNLETIAADPEKVEKTKSEGRKFIDNTTQAAERAKEVADQTTASAKETYDISVLFVGQEEEQMKAEEAAENAENAARAVKEAEDRAITYVKLVEEAIKKLDAAVVAAKEKEKEKQVEPQPQPQEQTNETSLPPTNATITNGITRNDGSSSPALLRVPLLLLLLLSVLGCMAVC